MPVTPRIDLASVTRLTELADYIVPFTIRVMCDLAVADQLIEGPLPVDVLARRVGADPGALTRGLRALAGRGIFTEVTPEVFGLTPLAEPLRSDHPFSVRECFPLMPPDIYSWARLTHSLRTGETAFGHVHGGTRYYDHFADHPYECVRFERSAESVNPFVLRTVAPALDLGTARTLVDVGSGHGTFVAGLLARHRELRAILLDLPHVVTEAPAVLARAGVADRCEVRGGSFFDPLPEGADVYLLKTIIHDWPDEQAAAILRNVRAAARPDSRLVIVESVSRYGNHDDTGKVMDVKALALFGGRTRTEPEFRALLDDAGFRLSRITPTSSMSVLEAVPAVPAPDGDRGTGRPAVATAGRTA
ncbi:methyltransferase [Micromonospora sp. NPDC049004]|uniref:methyltransferase n=1 Tax=Micromonospora sp. NPDC049004 TaxID=3154348 RepID=UPI0033E2156C